MAASMAAAMLVATQQVQLATKALQTLPQPIIPTLLQVLHDGVKLAQGRLQAAIKSNHMTWEQICSQPLGGTDSACLVAQQKHLAKALANLVPQLLKHAKSARNVYSHRPESCRRTLNLLWSLAGAISQLVRALQMVNSRSDDHSVGSRHMESTLDAMLRWILAATREQPAITLPWPMTSHAFKSELVCMLLPAISHIGSLQSVSLHAEEMFRSLWTLPCGYIDCLCCIVVEQLDDRISPQHSHAISDFRSFESSVSLVVRLSQGLTLWLGSSNNDQVNASLHFAIPMLLSPAVMDLMKRYVMRCISAPTGSFLHSCYSNAHAVLSVQLAQGLATASNMLSDDASGSSSSSSSNNIGTSAQASRGDSRTVKSGPIPRVFVTDVQLLRTLRVCMSTCTDNRELCIINNLMTLLTSTLVTAPPEEMVKQDPDKPVCVLNLLHHCLLFTSRWMQQQQQRQRCHSVAAQQQQQQRQQQQCQSVAEQQQQQQQQQQQLQQQQEEGKEEEGSGAEASVTCRRMMSSVQNLAHTAFNKGNPFILPPADGIRPGFKSPWQDQHGSFDIPVPITLNTWYSMPGSMAMLEALSRDEVCEKGISLLEVTPLMFSTMRASIHAASASGVSQALNNACVSLAATLRKLLQPHNCIVGPLWLEREDEQQSLQLYCDIAGEIALLQEYVACVPADACGYSGGERGSGSLGSSKPCCCSNSKGSACVSQAGTVEQSSYCHSESGSSRPVSTWARLRVLLNMSLARLSVYRLVDASCSDSSGGGSGPISAKNEMGTLLIQASEHLCGPDSPFSEGICEAAVYEETSVSDARQAGMWERFAAAWPGGRLLPGCSYLGCTNLQGVSEAALPTRLCSGCRRVRYCSDVCQRAAWSKGGHMLVCGKDMAHI